MAGFVVFSYSIIALYGLAIVLTVRNFYEFVVTKQKFSLSHPLLIFYVLVFLCFSTDIVYSIVIVTLYTEWRPFVIFMPPTFKVLAGIEQIWMMVELILHINTSIAVK